MKKNLRIASAAAAALLAVAPVAASAVNPANADVTVNNQTPSSNPSKPKADGDITINFSLNANADTSVEAAQKSVKVSAQGSSASLGDIKNTTDPKTNQVTIVYGTNNSGAGETAGTPVAGPLKAGVNYAIKVTGLTLSNLTTGKNYSIAGGTFTKGADENGNYSASTLKHGDDFTSDNFQVYDTKKTGSVSFVNSNNSLVKSGSIKLSSLTPASGKYNVSDVVKAIVGDSTTKPYQPVVDNGNATASWNDTKAEVKKALINDGVDVASDGTFTAPAGNVVIPVTATASNGNKATLRVTLVVDSNTEAQTSGLKFKLNPTSTLSDKASITAPAENSNDPYTLDLKQNATDTASSIASQFTATYEGKNGEAKLDYSTPVTVKSTNLNTAVVGKYQVVLTATNPTNNKSKDITVEVTVGDPGKTATVEAGSDVANVVNIDGNNVTSTSTNLANGAKVATYGTTSVKGVSYTRINSADSNEYVLTKYVDGSIKSSQSKTTSLDVMYKSAIYNKDGKATGKHIKGYTSTEFEADKDGNPVEVTINGGKFLKLAGNKGYVRARNVRGSKMTLKKNAYVYKSNGKRASRKLLKKGSTVTVYGGQYRAIRHYRKNAVRIGHNRYVKVVNVKYRLAD